MLNKSEFDRKIREMPPLTESVNALLALLNVADHSLRDVARVVECDGQLTIQVLNAVNSSAFALPCKVDSLDHAIAYLGERTIMGIALGTCNAHIYGSPLEGYESSPGALWSASLKTAIAAASLGPLARTPVERSLAYTGGIVHDVGKAILSDLLNGKAAEAVARVDRGDAEDYLMAERELVGIDHCAAGSRLAEYWGLAPALISVIEYHHHPDQAPAEHASLTYVVHMADAIAMMAGGEGSSDDMAYRFDESCDGWLELSASDLMDVIFATVSEYESTREALKIGT